MTLCFGHELTFGDDPDSDEHVRRTVVARNLARFPVLAIRDPFVLHIKAKGSIENPQNDA